MVTPNKTDGPRVSDEELHDVCAGIDAGADVIWPLGDYAPDLQDTRAELAAIREENQPNWDALGKFILEYQNERRDLNTKLATALAEVERLREELEFYADRASYLHSGGMFPVVYDAGARARRALKSEPSEKEQPDPFRCPECGGHADNGHDRELPPNPYLCTKCSKSEPPE